MKKIIGITAVAAFAWAGVGAVTVYNIIKEVVLDGWEGLDNILDMLQYYCGMIIGIASLLMYKHWILTRLIGGYCVYR